MPEFAPLPFGEWRPDVALLDSQFAGEAENVFPGALSYKPMPSLMTFAAATLASGGNDSNTKVLLHCDGADATTTFTDSASGGAAHTWTAAGNAQIDTADSKFGGASGLFDGTGDVVTTPDSADFTLGSGDFTIDFWTKPAVDGTLLYLAGQADAGITAAASAWALRRTAGNKIEFLISNGAAFTTITGATTNITNAGGWRHIAVVRSGSGANNITIYINGAIEVQGTFAGTVFDSAAVLTVGGANAAATTPWNGWIDEFRLSNTARWTAAFTAPTVAYFLGGKCVGLFAARKSDNSWKIYAGTTLRLFTYDNGNAGWVDVSRTTGNYSGPPANELWSFDQFGTFLYATNVNDALQRIDVDSGTNFAAVPGSPPQARIVKQIGDFLFLAALSSNNRKIRWSAINDPTGWTVGTNLCDEQEFPEGGPVVGVAGSEIGYVLQDRCIRVMQFLPGDTTLIFTFSRVLKERGCRSYYGYQTVGNTLYFASDDGFYALLGQQVFTIGQDKVNEWFQANSDQVRTGFMQCISSNRPYVMWPYYKSSASVNYDGLLVYDWSLQKWSHGNVEAQVWAILATAGLDLDTTGSEVGDALLDSTASSLDSVAYEGGRPQVAAMNPSGFLASHNGSNLQATVETAEVHLQPGYRAFASEVYPLGDASGGTITVATRENLQTSYVWGSPIALEAIGSAAVYTTGRLHRFRYIAPASATWTHAQGVLVYSQQDGSV